MSFNRKGSSLVVVIINLKLELSVLDFLNFCVDNVVVVGGFRVLEEFMWSFVIFVLI